MDSSSLRIEPKLESGPRPPRKTKIIRHAGNRQGSCKRSICSYMFNSKEESEAVSWSISIARSHYANSTTISGMLAEHLRQKVPVLSTIVALLEWC